MKPIITFNPLKLSLLFVVFSFVFLQKSVGQINHSTLPIPAANIAQGSNNNVIYVLQITNSAPFPLTPTSISFKLSGLLNSSDFTFFPPDPTPIKIYQSSSSTFSLATATLIASAPNLAGLSNVTEVTYPTMLLTGAISVSFPEVSYIFITADIDLEFSTMGHYLKINGATNPVIVTYASDLFPPGVNEMQTDISGIQTISNSVTPPVTPILIANYTFCNNANDATANANNGTVNGAILSADRFGNANSAYSFSTSNNISVPNNSALQLGTNNYTLSYWIKTTANDGVIIGKPPHGNSIMQYINADGTIQGRSEYPAGVVNSTHTINNGTWHHVVFARNGTNAKIYIDGVPSNTGTVPLTNISNSDNLSIGHNGANPFNGTLDDIKIYSGALTDAEIAAKYAEENNPTILVCGTPAPVLVANYTFCNNANDVSGNANNGTVNGATLTTDRFGNVNSAYSFDGINDFISTSALATNQTDNWTMSAWVKPNSLSQLGSILLNGYDDGGSGNGFSMIQSDGGSGSGNVLAGLNGGVAFYSSGGGFPNITDWYHVVMTRSGGTTKFYINGVQTSSTSSSAINIFNGSSTFRIGSQNGNRFFNGAIDDVKVYSSALTNAQVIEAYNAENTNVVLSCGPIVCPTITVSTVTNTQNECDGTATFSATGGMENYTFSSLSGGIITGNSFTAKTGTYTIIATDANACTGTVSVTITNNDSVAPTFTNCPANIIVQADANCTKVVTWNLPIATDNCIASIETIAGFTYRGSSNGKSYYFSNTGANFETAKANCITLGGNMLVINSAAENAYINSIAGGDLVLLGITDSVTEGTWIDVFGETATYFNWNSGEPNNGGNEDYATTNGGGWNDLSNITSQYILEKGVTIVQTEGYTSGTTIPVGTSTVKYVATDAAGNSTECSFNVTVEPYQTASISYPAEVCTNSGEYQTTITGAIGGAFSVSPPTGLSINTETGAINTLNAVPGDYIINYTILANETCPAITADFTITVNAAPVISCQQNIEVCKNEPVFNLPNIPEGATVTVGGVINNTGTFNPSADWSAFNNGDANASVAVVYTLTNENGCISTCNYIILVKRLPNAFSSIYFPVGNNSSETTKSVCLNSGDVQLRFDGGTGSMVPITFYYELNGVPKPNVVLSAAAGGIIIPTTTAGTFVYHVSKVTINTGCELLLDKTATLTIHEIPAAPEFSKIPPNCLVGTGSVTITTLASEYSFDNGENFQLQNSKSLSPGTYLLKIKDVNGCVSAAAEVIIEQQPGTPDAPVVSVIHPTCVLATGTATITNPVEGYNYFLNGNTFQNASSTTVNGNTTYNVIAVNADGCQSAPTEIIVNAQPATPLDPEVTVTQPTCTIGTGEISIVGLSGFTYSFGGSFGINNTSGPLSAGDYIVKIKSAAGCESPGQTITIDQQPASPEMPTLTQTPANCSSSTGSITVSAPIGTGLEYKLDNGNFQAGPTFNNVITGSHTVTVKNAAGCSSSASIMVGSDLQAPIVTVPSSISVCVSSPEITLSGALPAGGTYSGNNVNNGVFNPNTPGTFPILYTVTGSNGCVGTNSFDIIVKPQFSVEIQPTAGSFQVCEGATNVGFQFLTSGANQGTTGFSVKYKLGENGAEQTVSTTDGIAVVNVDTSIPGVYNYYLLDASSGNGCDRAAFGNVIFTIKPKPAITCPLDMEALTTDPIIVLGSIGTYSGTGVSLNGSNYQFNPATAGDGVHEITYTITGENGCTNFCTFNITVTGVAPCNVTLASFTAETVCQPFPIPLSFSGLVPNNTNIIKLGVNEVLIPSNSYADRTITVITDGLGNGSTTLDVSGYQTVEYKLTVKEVKIGECVLIPTTAITANFTKKPRGGGQSVDITETAICNGGGALNGVLGTVPNANYPTNFTYQIWNINTNLMVANGTGIANPLAASTLQFNIPSVILPAGSYQFRIVSQDIDGCGITAVLNDNFSVLPTPVLTATAEITNLDCSNSTPTGAIDQTISGGSGTYTFAWSNNAITEDISGLTAGNYSVTITDPTSCGSPSIVKNYIVTKPNAIVVNAASITSECNGNNGTASLSATGGNGSFSFTASNGGTIDMAAFNAQAGTYTITATDSKGCTGTLILTISNCEDSEVICTTTQNGYGNAQFTACQPDGSSPTVGLLMANALNGSPYVFGVQANNRIFTLSPGDITTGGAMAPIFKMLSGVSNASSKFGLGGASYGVASTWPRVPLTNTGKIANNLFAHSMALYFNLQNSTKLDQVALNTAIINTESTLICGSQTGSGVVSSYQLPTSVVSFLNNSANGYAATVAGLFQLNNDALGGKTGLPNLSTLAAAADKVNKAFNGCRLLASLPANTTTFGTNINVTEGNKAFDAPAKGGLYMTLIEGNPATGHIFGVVEVGSNGLSGFAPVITNNYFVIMGTDPEGSRIPQAPAGYRIVSQIISNGTAGFTGQGTQKGSGEVAIGTYNPQAGSRVAAGGGYEITFVLEPTGPLPVRLISFTGKSTEKGNELNWKTSSEQNFSHYEVERSNSPQTPGGGLTSQKFVKIGQVAGNQSENYEFIDSTPLLGRFDASTGGLYYRLKMVDLDGKSEYSKIIYLNTDKASLELNVYPNPANEYFLIENTDTTELTITVLDALGRQVISPITSSETSTRIETSSLTSGNNYILIKQGNKVSTRKILISK